MLTEDQQIFEQIAKAKKILIAFRQDFTGDAVASALALTYFLRQANKQANVVCSGFNAPSSFLFLPLINKIKNDVRTERRFIISLDTSRAAAKEISYQIHDEKLDFIVIPQNEQFHPDEVSAQAEDNGYDLIIVVASPDLESLGQIYHQNTHFFFNTPVINIDHHPDNEKFGQINKVDITAISTTEIIFNLLNGNDGAVIDGELATYLLTGIFTESKSFKSGSLTPDSLMASSQLISLGADREVIVRNLYQNKGLNTLKLWGRLLAKLKSDLNSKLIWSCLNKVDFEKTGGGIMDLPGVIEELIINIPEAEVIVVFHEDSGGGKTKIYLYSARNISALSLLKEYDPAGSKNSAQAILDKTAVDAEKEIIDNIKNKLSKLPI